MFEEEANRERYAADLAYDHDLTLPQGRQLAALAIHSLDPSFEPECLDHLADPAVVEAFASSPLGMYADEESIERVDALASRAIAEGRHTAGAWYLRSVVAESKGDTDAQRALLNTCIERDPQFGPGHASLGFLAFVAGDERVAARHLRASGDHRVLGMLHTLTHFPSSSRGRNEPCPCGSERKLKHCCAGDRAPLESRTVWLWEKVAVWLHRLPQHGSLIEVACRLADIDDPFDDEDGAITAALLSPMIDALALIDAGLLHVFLRRMGHLLPDDERALVERWVREGGTSLWVVDAVNPGSSLTLTDVRSGRTVEAINGSVSRCTEPGEVVFGTVVSSGEGWFLSCHPEGVSPETADTVVAMLDAGFDGMTVAGTVLREARSATM